MRCHHLSYRPSHLAFASNFTVGDPVLSSKIAVQDLYYYSYQIDNSKHNIIARVGNSTETKNIDSKIMMLLHYYSDLLQIRLIGKKYSWVIFPIL